MARRSGEWLRGYAWADCDNADDNGHYSLQVHTDGGTDYKLRISENLHHTAQPRCWTASGAVLPPLDEFENVADPSIGDTVTVGAGTTTTADFALAGGTLSGTNRRATDN